MGIFSVTLNPMKVEKAPHPSGIPVSLGWKMSLKSLTMLFLLHSVTFYSILTQYLFNRHLLGTYVMDHLILSRAPSGCHVMSSTPINKTSWVPSNAVYCMHASAMTTHNGCFF